MQNSLSKDPSQQAHFHPPIIHALLVDDNEFDRKHIKRLGVKSDLNLQITEVATIIEMDQALQNNRFDLVFLDYALDDGDGFEALNLIHANPLNNQTGVVMITGTKSKDVAVNAFRNGCHDFVSKDDLSADEMKHAILRSIVGARSQGGAKLRSIIAETVEGSLRNSGFVQQITSQVRRHARGPLTDQSVKLINFLDELEKDDDEPFLFRN